jgi:hypothetical protein
MLLIYREQLRVLYGRMSPQPDIHFSLLYIHRLLKLITLFLIMGHP